MTKISYILIIILVNNYIGSINSFSIILKQPSHNPHLVRQLGPHLCKTSNPSHPPPFAGSVTLCSV